MDDCQNIAEFSESPRTVGYAAWDIVRLKGRTDLYRVYTYAGKKIFVGMNSDTVTDESRDEVMEVVERAM